MWDKTTRVMKILSKKKRTKWRERLAILRTAG